MTDKAMPDLTVGGALSLTDYVITRIGAAIVDTRNQLTDIATLMRAQLYGTVGQGLSIKEGTNARMGTATLVAGTVTVLNTSVTANTRVIPFLITLGTVTRPVALGNTARVAATSFTIVSGDVTDTSTIGWILIEPAP